MIRRPRTCIVVADDFGRSCPVNRAIIEAHTRGIVTSAGIMATGAAFDEAVGLARRNPDLSIGLHVTLCDGRAVLPRSDIPGLADVHGHFEKSPARAWIRYLRPGLQEQIVREIHAQFAAVKKAGIHPVYVDGHHHIQMHPLVFPVLCRIAAGEGVRWIRITGEPLFPGHWLRRGFLPVLEWFVFALLGAGHRKEAGRHGLSAVPATYGLWRTGSLDERYLESVLNRMQGVSEVFTHPDGATERGVLEVRTLTSPRIRSMFRSGSLRLAGYRELSTMPAGPGPGMAGGRWMRP